MKVGFTGTRRGMTDVQKVMFQTLLPAMEEFHHGSCQGADVEAAKIVKKAYTHPPKVIAHPGPIADTFQEKSEVDDETMPPKNHFARNRDIVAACDLLIACPCEAEHQSRGGTWYTIDHARKVGKKVTVIYPDGSLE